MPTRELQTPNRMNSCGRLIAGIATGSKNNMQTLPLRLQNWVTDLARARLSANEPPLRAELFSVEQLARHAKALAANHLVVTRQGSNSLLARLRQNEDILRIFNRATLAVNPGRRITPAAEWLLDNFYLIEEQIQMAKRHLPHGYSRELPRLLNVLPPDCHVFMTSCWN